MIKILVLILFAFNLYGVEKVIALSPAINEIIYALKAQNTIVANTTYCNYPKESIKKPKVGGYFSPNLEKIVTLHPDIVLMQENTKFAQKLLKLGIKTELFKLQTINDIKKSIIRIGTILNKEEKAKKIIQTIDIKLKSIKNIIHNKKILIVIGHNTSLDKKIFVVGHNLYLDDIIKESGNKNAFTINTFSQPILNLENIIALNPDIVILLTPYMKRKNLTKKDLLKPWKNLPLKASQNNTIYIESHEYAGIPSNRLIYFLNDFKSFLENAKTK